MLLLDDLNDVVEKPWLRIFDANIIWVQIVIGLVIIFVLTMALKKRRFLSKNFMLIGILILISGYLVYLRGFCWSGTENSFFALTLRPLLMSVEMFAAQNDLQEVDPVCLDSASYMTVFTIVHIAAIAFTGIFTLHFFKFKIQSWQRFRKALATKHNDAGLYVFFGINERTVTLATDIRANHKDAVIVVTEFDEDNDDTGLSVDSLLTHVTSNRDLLEQAGRVGAIIKRKTRILDDPNENNYVNYAKKVEEYKRKANEALTFMGIDRLMEKTDETCFFLFSSDENQNIESLLKLRSSFTETDETGKNDYHGKKRIFCLVNSAQSNTMLERESMDNLDIKIIDTASLSIGLLMNASNTQPVNGQDTYNKYIHHPVNYIDIDTKQALATSEFAAMVVGFGETGRTALKWLYEFGQFKYDDEAKQSHFIAVDSEMDNLVERFLTRCPGLDTESSGIEYDAMDYNSREFWQLMRENIKRLNYIVVTVGDDEHGITLAVDIYELAQRSGKDMSKFGIFVRSYCDENIERLKEIAKKVGNIIIFGSTIDVFKERCVLNDYLLPKAETFYYNYEKQRIDYAPSEWDNPEEYAKKSPEQCWNERHNKRVKSDDEMQKKANIMKIARQESQDRVNALHLYTKIELSGGRGVAKEKYDEIQEAFIKKMPREEIYAKYPYFHNLSMLEHLRWNAAHKALGYIPLPEGEEIAGGKSCDEIRKWHKCIVTWDELTIDYKWYDSIVAITSFYLAKEEAES
jgi:hypothetical protein